MGSRERIRGASGTVFERAKRCTMVFILREVPTGSSADVWHRHGLHMRWMRQGFLPGANVTTDRYSHLVELDKSERSLTIYRVRGTVRQLYTTV